MCGQGIRMMWRKQPGPGRSMAMAALLALAAVMISLPVYPTAASSHAHGMSHAHAADATQQAHASQDMNDGSRRGHNGIPAADCEATVTGCCAMAHCQPVLASATLELARVTLKGETWAGTSVRGSGSDPGIILPPPRNVSK